MAERLFGVAADGRHEGRSAGSHPGTEAHPVVLEALLEVGIDATDHVPRRLDDELLDWADVVVATCDGACPLTPGKRRVDWHLRDPMHQPLGEVRQIRDEVRARVDALLATL
jgi:arsenate reductase